MKECSRISVFIWGSLLLALAFPATACNDKTPVYASDRQALIDGSLFYNEAGCARCHGLQLDGQGPEAKTITKDYGFAVPDFKRKLAPQTTPLNYFRAITMGSKRYPKHAYQAYTDRGRWAMAHYLYLQAQPLQGSEALRERRQAMLKMQTVLKKVYSRRRRWGLGYKPLDQRPPAPQLEDLLKQRAAQ